MASKTNSLSPTSSTIIDEPQSVILKVNIPSLQAQKALSVSTNDPIWSIKKAIIMKVTSEFQQGFNYGLFLQGENGKEGKFLDEAKTVGSYGLDGTVQFQVLLLYSDSQLISPVFTSLLNTARRLKRN
jgi:hypothetical protein